MTTQRLTRIVKGSTTEVLSRAQTRARGVTAGGVLQTGFMPVVSTALVTSLVSMVGGGTWRGEHSYDSAIARYKLGDPMIFYWSEIYSRYIEDGDERFPGWHYWKTNAQEWDDIVKSVARRVRNR